MQKLIHGLHRFQREIVAKDREFFSRLAEGQRPETLFITCSDSRISPNMLTQTRPGELFIVRNAGNLVPPHGPMAGGEAATIEYAVRALGVRDIIVCGHSHCGAMAGLLDPASTERLPAMRQWLSHASRTKELIEASYNHLEGQARVAAAIQENVLVQMENLRTHPAVAEALAEHRVQLHGWVYKLEKGSVYAYDPDLDEFDQVSSTEPSLATGPAVEI